MKDSDRFSAPSLHIFLAVSLGVLMTQTRYAGARWTKSRVADYITGSDEISGTLSDTTLGRFLDIDHRQEASPATIRMVAEFLILMKAIEKDDLEGFNARPDMRLATAIELFYAPQANKQRDLSFRRSLRGLYRQNKREGAYFQVTRFILFRDGEGNSFRIDEAAILYRLPQSSLADDTFTVPEKKGGTLFLREMNRIGATRVLAAKASGYAIINPSIGVAFLKSIERGIDGVLTMEALIFDPDDRIAGMHTRRNNGWNARELGQISVPEILSDSAPPQLVMKKMLEEGRYENAGFISIRDQELAKNQRDDYRKDIRYFLKNSLSDVKVNIMSDFDFSDSNKVAQEAFEAGDLALFEQAIAKGADPNATPDGYNGSYVCILAARPMLDWVRVVAKAPGYDPFQRSSEGKLPSALAIEGIEAWVMSDETLDIAEEMRETCFLLREVEIIAKLEANGGTELGGGPQ